jgi:DNA-binding response OmpR family regulator
MIAPTSSRRPRALLLDDDALLQSLLRSALRCRGYEVLSAADGDAGVGLLLDELLRLDVLVVDLDLPGRDGWSMLRLIREAGGERELPVVVLAANATPAVRAQLRALGADAVVQPSAGPVALAAAVDAALRHPAHRTRQRAPVASSLAGLLVPMTAAA